MFECCVVRLDLRTDTQQDMCSKEIGLLAENISSSLDSILVSPIGVT